MKNIHPPNYPWQELRYQADAGGTLSFYYSDELSKLPVRAVTKVGDNKADPNFETLTYGLFSTCQKTLRSSIVKRAKKYLFFVSKRKNKRVLVGYYIIKWFTPVVNGVNDFAIAAEEAFLTSNPVSLDAVDKECGTNIDKWFRLFMFITEDDCIKLKNFLRSSPNSIDDYISEIHRLEMFNKAQGGHLYIGRKLDQRYSWDMAAPYIVQEYAVNTTPLIVKNSSPSNWWNCETCGSSLKNKSLLRICPNCKSINTLTPLVNISE